MENVLELKKAMRKKMLFKRSQLDNKAKAIYDQWICESVWNIIDQKNYHNIHCYLPMGTEINITPLIQKMLDENLTVVTPKTLPKRKLENLVLKSLTQVEKGVFGTTHPSNSKTFDDEYDLIIIPGLAFDDQNYRLGYGGGYYDNFLINCPKSFKLGIFYPFQKHDVVPREPHDIQLDKILFNDVINLLP